MEPYLSHQPTTPETIEIEDGLILIHGGGTGYSKENAYHWSLRELQSAGDLAHFLSHISEKQWGQPHVVLEVVRTLAYWFDEENRRGSEATPEPSGSA